MAAPRAALSLANWVSANSTGNLTLPSVGGSTEGQTYDWAKLRFFNGSEEKNITDAGDAGWISSTLQYWGPNAFSVYGFREICSAGCDKTTISSWEGIFVNSSIDNLTIIRQN